jgi:hypothetical protein
VSLSELKCGMSESRRFIQKNEISPITEIGQSEPKSFLTSAMMIKAVWSFETSARSQLVHGVSIQNQDQQHQIPSIKESTD